MAGSDGGSDDGEIREKGCCLGFLSGSDILAPDEEERRFNQQFGPEGLVADLVGMEPESAIAHFEKIKYLAAQIRSGQFLGDSGHLERRLADAENVCEQLVMEIVNSRIDRQCRIIETIEGFADKDYDFTRNWNGQTDWEIDESVVKELREDWKTIPILYQEKNQAFWDMITNGWFDRSPELSIDSLAGRYREALDGFYQKRRLHFSQRNEEAQTNLEAKEELLGRLENLLTATDGRFVSDQLKAIRETYKGIGHVPSAEFERMKERFRELSEEVRKHSQELYIASLEDQVEKQEAFLEKLRASIENAESFIDRQIAARGLARHGLAHDPRLLRPALRMRLYAEKMR